MTKKAILLFLGSCFILSLGHTKTLIEITIEVQSDLFAPGPQALEQAELYCHQALGARAQTKFIHNSSILCSRELDLEEIDPSIGKYLDHARWILRIFSGQTLEIDDHQLVENTIKILSQIGAPALSVLWEDHVEHYDPVTQITYFQCAIEEIIDNIKSHNYDTLKEVLNILVKEDKGHINLSQQKSKLLGRGNWPYAMFLGATEEALINSLLKIRNYGPTVMNDIEALARLLNGFYVALNDKVLRGHLDKGNQKLVLTLTCEHLSYLPASVLSTAEQTGLKKILKQYGCLK